MDVVLTAVHPTKPTLALSCGDDQRVGCLKGGGVSALLVVFVNKIEKGAEFLDLLFAITNPALVASQEGAASADSFALT